MIPIFANQVPAAALPPTRRRGSLLFRREVKTADLLHETEEEQTERINRIKEVVAASRERVGTDWVRKLERVAEYEEGNERTEEELWLDKTLQDREVTHLRLVKIRLVNRVWSKPRTPAQIARDRHQDEYGKHRFLEEQEALRFCRGDEERMRHMLEERVEIKGILSYLLRVCFDVIAAMPDTDPLRYEQPLQSNGVPENDSDVNGPMYDDYHGLRLLNYAECHNGHPLPYARSPEIRTWLVTSQASLPRVPLPQLDDAVASALFYSKAMLPNDPDRLRSVQQALMRLSADRSWIDARRAQSHLLRVAEGPDETWIFPTQQTEHLRCRDPMYNQSLSACVLNTGVLPATALFPSATSPSAPERSEYYTYALFAAKCAVALLKTRAELFVRSKTVPMDCRDYCAVFGSTRQPRSGGKDEIRSYEPPHEETDEERQKREMRGVKGRLTPSHSAHITVMWRGLFFIVDVVNNSSDHLPVCGGVVYPTVLADMLEQIMVQNASVTEASLAIPHLALQGRTEWAKHYALLCERKKNVDAFTALNNSLFVLCLQDTDISMATRARSAMDPCTRIMYGSPHNRWPDHALNLVVNPGFEVGLVTNTTIVSGNCAHELAASMVYDLRHCDYNDCDSLYNTLLSLHNTIGQEFDCCSVDQLRQHLSGAGYTGITEERMSAMLHDMRHFVVVDKKRDVVYNPFKTLLENYESCPIGLREWDDPLITKVPKDLAHRPPEWRQLHFESHASVFATTTKALLKAYYAASIFVEQFQDPEGTEVPTVWTAIIPSCTRKILQDKMVSHPRTFICVAMYVTLFRIFGERDIRGACEMVTSLPFFHCNRDLCPVVTPTMLELAKQLSFSATRPSGTAEINAMLIRCLDELESAIMACARGQGIAHYLSALAHAGEELGCPLPVLHCNPIKELYEPSLTTEAFNSSSVTHFCTTARARSAVYVWYSIETTGLHLCVQQPPSMIPGSAFLEIVEETVQLLIKHL